MRVSSVLSIISALAIASVQATPTTLKQTRAHPIAPAPPCPPSPVFTAYAKAGKSVLSINGKTEYFMGTNSYWIGFLTNNSDVDLVMSHLATTGLKVLRVWGFNDVSTTPSSGTVWYQSFINGSEPVINTGANGLQRLDYVVKSAEAHGISLIINFVNNWNDYGGMNAYTQYYGIGITDWYNSTAAQAQYHKYIAAVVARYKTSKAVFAWELANEPRCHGCPTSIVTNWIAKTAKYIKSLDSNHMVTIGDEGFGLDGGSDTSYPYQTVEGMNFTANLAVHDIDFGTYHLYPSSWGEDDSWAPSWIASHAKAGALAGKPVLLEEYGSLLHSNETSWQAEVLSTRTAGDMYWQFGDVLSSGKTSDDGYAIYYGTAEYTTLVKDHAAAMAAKKVT